jgi:hypothetical protein
MTPTQPLSSVHALVNLANLAPAPDGLATFGILLWRL